MTLENAQAPHPAIVATQQLDNDGKPLTADETFNKTYDENARRRSQYGED
jgi:hypothetical protein